MGQISGRINENRFKAAFFVENFKMNGKRAVLYIGVIGGFKDA